MVAWFVCPPTTVEQMLSARALAALVGACAALWLASTPLGVSGHGMLKVPAARSSCQSCNNYCPHCMNAGGTGMVSSHSSGVWPAVETDATSVGLEVLAVFFLGPSHYPPPHHPRPQPARVPCSPPIVRSLPYPKLFFPAPCLSLVCPPPPPLPPWQPGPTRPVRRLSRVQSAVPDPWPCGGHPACGLRPPDHRRHHRTPQGAH